MNLPFKPRVGFEHGGNYYHSHLTYTARTEELKAKVLSWKALGLVDTLDSGADVSGSGKLNTE